MKLSVAIITKNEEHNLARTLASVQFADEIIVVDSGSIDRTVKIARSFHAKIYEEPWRGFSVQKNFAIEQCSGAWILSLDADEEVSPELRASVEQIVAFENTPVDAYFLRRRNLFLGRWMKRGGFYPDAKLRLFRRVPLHDASPIRFGERAVHENIAFEGETRELEGDLIHHAYPTLEVYREHMDRYSTLGAEVLIAKGKTSRSTLAFAANVWLVPAFNFAWNYIFRLGFLDGREGLLLHLGQASYTSQKYAKAWLKAGKETGNPTSKS